MSTTPASPPPLAIGALLRFALQDIRRRIYAGVVDAGFDDVRPAHVTLFRWPGPHGRRPSDLAAAAGITKQAINGLLRDLERHGYVTLSGDANDDRARVVQLTARGRKLHETAVAVHSAIEREWARAVGTRRFEQLRETLVALVDVPPVAADVFARRRPVRRTRDR